MTDIHSLGYFSFARAINDSGQVAGYYYRQDTGMNYAFLWSNGNMIDLGSYTGVPGSVAYGIGNSGDVVGQGQGTPGGVNHAILWDGGNAYDLNTLLDSSGAGWILEGAWDINDNGQIATYGRFQDGWMHALLLTPIPEPGSLALLAIGLVGVAYSRRGCRYKPDAGHPPYCGTDLSIPLQVRHSH